MPKRIPFSGREIYDEESAYTYDVLSARESDGMKILEHNRARFVLRGFLNGTRTQRIVEVSFNSHGELEVRAIEGAIVVMPKSGNSIRVEVDNF